MPPRRQKTHIPKRPKVYTPEIQEKTDDALRNYRDKKVPISVLPIIEEVPGLTIHAADYDFVRFRAEALGIKLTRFARMKKTEKKAAKKDAGKSKVEPLELNKKMKREALRILGILKKNKSGAIGIRLLATELIRQGGYTQYQGPQYNNLVAGLITYLVKKGEKVEKGRILKK